MREHVVDEYQQIVQHRRHARCLEQIGVVLELYVQAVHTLTDADREIELCQRHVDLDVGDLHMARLGGHWLRPLVGEQDVEER